MRFAIFVQQLNSLGGIERVAIEQLRIFRSRGCEITLLTEQPIITTKGLVKECPIVLCTTSAGAREKQLREVFLRTRPDLLILHGTAHKCSSVDTRVAEELGVPSVCVVHFPFNSNLALESEHNGWKLFIQQTRGKCCLATVSAVDALWWRALGCRAFHVQNPFVHPIGLDNVRRAEENGTTNIIWVGRQAEPKQPEAALMAFSRVHRLEPRTRLMMIGGTDKGWRFYKKLAKRLDCLDAVEFISERPDLNQYWRRADIHLLTSVVESFCLVWAEAKAASIPTVMYELPYLELAEDRRGYVAVEQHNVEALADALCDLVRNFARRQRMGIEAKASLENFNDEAVWESWRRLVDGLKGNDGYEVDATLKTIVSQVYGAYSFRKDKHQWEENMERDFRKLFGCSLRSFASLLSNALRVLRRVKSIFHG